MGDSRFWKPGDAQWKVPRIALRRSLGMTVAEGRTVSNDGTFCDRQSSIPLSPNRQSLTLGFVFDIDVALLLLRTRSPSNLAV